MSRLADLQVVREGQDPLVPERASLFDDGPWAARVVQPYVGDRAALLLGGLRGDAGAGVLLGESAVFDEPLHANLRVGVDDDDQREHRRHLGFDQQWDVLDDHRIVVGRRDELRPPVRHQRMHDAVQGGALLVVAERDRGQGRAVQRPFG